MITKIHTSADPDTCRHCIRFGWFCENLHCLESWTSWMLVSGRGSSMSRVRSSSVSSLVSLFLAFPGPPGVLVLKLKICLKNIMHFSVNTLDVAKQMTLIFQLTLTLTCHHEVYALYSLKIWPRSKRQTDLNKRSMSHNTQMCQFTHIVTRNHMNYDCKSLNI